MEFRLLGAVEARIDGRVVDLGPGRQRSVLAALLVDVNQVVPVNQLVDRVWGEHPPPSARNSLHSYLSRLRKVLGSTNDVRISYHSGGYLLALDPVAVDMHRFRCMIADARAAVDERALELFEQALGLWRGEAFAGLDIPWLATVRTMLEQERSAAILDHIDVALRCGQHAALLPTLSTLAGENPLDERLAGQFMLALYRSGRQADALDHYHQTQRRLADELGIDPSPPLQELQGHILTADSTLAEANSDAVAWRSPPPRQLPAAPRVFIGRGSELDRLTVAMEARAESGATVAISAISGAGGIGKTALALCWAYQHLDRFPDGQLHVNLRGFDPASQPTPAAVVVRGFLDALGVAPAAIPIDPDAQVGLYRSLVAGKRMLIVLDNARDTAQVASLLPGSPSCTVLITSRTTLTGLVTAHGARPMALDILGDDDARELLTQHLGATRLNADPHAVNEFLRHCGGLPLALGIVAARATTYPSLPLATLAEELNETVGRLDALDAGEATVNLRAVFSWSYHALTPQAAALFELLGSAPGPDISSPAAASLAALPIAQTRHLLRELETCHLVQQPEPSRYRMHDLIRLYAAEEARHHQSQASLEAALRRLVDYYLHTAHAADRLLDPALQSIHLADPLPGCHLHPLGDQAAALTWIAAEHANLLASQHAAIEQGWHVPVWQLASTLTTFHWRRGHLNDSLMVWQAGLAATQQVADPAAQTLAHRRLGYAYTRAGRHTEAIQHLRQALTLAADADNTQGMAHTHFALASAWGQQGEDRQALEHATRALHLYQPFDHPAWTARALREVAWWEVRLGHHAQGRTHCEAALALFRRHHHREAEAGVLDCLGYIAYTTGQHAQAQDYYEQALALLRDLGNTFQQADTLDRLAKTHHTLSEHDQARATWQQAAELYQAQHRITDAERIKQQLAELSQ